MENFQTLLDYTIQVGPSLVSILGMILSLVISIARQGKLNSNQLAAIDSLANDLRQENADVQEESRQTKALLKAVLKENAELKATLNTIIDEHGPIAKIKEE